MVLVFRLSKQRLLQNPVEQQCSKQHWSDRISPHTQRSRPFDSFIVCTCYRPGISPVHASEAVRNSSVFCPFLIWWRVLYTAVDTFPGNRNLLSHKGRSWITFSPLSFCVHSLPSRAQAHGKVIILSLGMGVRSIIMMMQILSLSLPIWELLPDSRLFQMFFCGQNTGAGDSDSWGLDSALAFQKETGC